MIGDLLMLAVTTGDYLQTESLFDPAYLFKGVPQLAGQMRPAFELLAFTILAAAGVRRWVSSPIDPLMGIVPVLVTGLFVAIIPLALNTADQAVDDLVAKTGLADPNTVFQKLMALSQPFRPMNRGEEINIKKLQTAQQAGADQYAQEQVRQHSFWGIDFSGATDFIKNIYNGATTSLKVAYDTIKDPLGAVGDALRMMIFKSLAFLGAGVVWIIMQICGLICYVYVSIRYLLIHLESIVLPVFVAMVVTESLRGQGHNFVMGLVGIIFWPLGWALGHIGTLAIGGWFASVLGALLGLQNGNVNLADGQIFDWLMNGDATGLPAVTPQTQACIILVALAGALILCIWVFLVTVSAPFLIGKALKSGSGIFGEMVGGTAKGAAGLGAAAAGLAALAMTGGGAAAAAGAGNAQAAAGGTSGGAAAGGSGGPPPIGADAVAALGNGSSLAQAGGGIGGEGAVSRSLASRATTRAPAGSGGIFAAGASGDVAYIPMAQEEMAAAFSGGGGGSSGSGGNGGSGSSGGGGGGSSSGGGGGSSGGSGGGGKAGGGKGKSARVSGSSARAYKAVMALGALQGVLESASQWDGGADFVGHTAFRASSGATNQFDRSRRLDRQDFDSGQEDDEKA
jgi:hypothetical protein